MSILRLSLRSRDAPTNSTEKLKLRLHQAVANMQVNEKMEVCDKKHKNEQALVKRRERRSSTPPPGCDEVALARKKKWKRDEEREGGRRHSRQSDDSGSAQCSSISNVSPKTRWVAKRSGHGRRKVEETAIVPAGLVSREDGRGVVPYEPSRHAIVVSRRDLEPGRPISTVVANDQGEYLVKRQRKFSRKGNEWQLVRKNYYAYWSPRTRGG